MDSESLQDVLAVFEASGDVFRFSGATKGSDGVAVTGAGWPA